MKIQFLDNYSLYLNTNDKYGIEGIRIKNKLDSIVFKNFLIKIWNNKCSTKNFKIQN